MRDMQNLRTRGVTENKPGKLTGGVTVTHPGDEEGLGGEEEEELVEEMEQQRHHVVACDTQRRPPHDSYTS